LQKRKPGSSKKQEKSKILALLPKGGWAGVEGTVNWALGKGKSSLAGGTQKTGEEGGGIPPKDVVYRRPAGTEKKNGLV